MNPRLNGVLLILIGLALGWALHLWHDLGLRLSPELRAADLLNIAVALLVAVFIREFVESRSSGLRAEKALVVEHAREAIRTVDAVHASFISGLDAPSVAKLTKDASNAILLVIDVLEIAQLGKAIKSAESAKSKYFGYKRIVTGDEQSRRSRTGVQQAESAERAYRELKQALFLTIHVVNRS